MRGLKGKNVLVTGGTSGIGQAIAVRFSEYGSNIAINYRQRPEEASGTEQQVQECIKKVNQQGVKNVLVKADVSRPEQVAEMFENAIGELGGIDILINNAGIQISENSEEAKIENVTSVLDVNLKGAFLCAQQTIRHFLETDKPGVIINISSVHQIIPKPGYIGYTMSKGGLQNLTRTLALEFAHRRIRVNAVAPGATITPINRAWVNDPDKQAQVAAHIPMRRAGTADEMGAAAAFLASEDAGYITGQTLYVDGGLTLYPDFRTPWSSE